MTHGVRRRGWRLAVGAAALCASAGDSLAEPRQWHALPVAGGADAVAMAAGLDPGLPAWRVLFEAARRRHGLWGEQAGYATVDEAGARPAAGSLVALPLAPEAWRRLLGREDLPDDRLALAILADRRSSLLYRGLAAFDESTLAALAAERDGLRRIHQNYTDVLAAFGARFRVRDGSVDVPGGEEAVPLWRGVVGVSPREPVPFLVALLGGSGGRRAFLYDAVARLDPARQRFALGMQHPPGPEREAALSRLASVFDREGAWWHAEGGAFARPEADAARLLREVRLGPDGTLAPPGTRAFWEAVFEGIPALTVNRGEPATQPPADAAWLAERIGTGAAPTRRLRLEQLTFAQRVFGDAGEETLPAVLQAVRALHGARTAMLALERLGTRDPALYAAGVAAARRASSVSDPRARRRALGGLQGALGVIDRVRFARTLDVAASERLARSLFELPFDQRAARDRALAAWVETGLLPELAPAVYGTMPAGDPETTVLRAMAGDLVEGRQDLVPFDWEGLRYRTDPGRAEFARLERARARQGGSSLAEALRQCGAPGPAAAKTGTCALGPVLTSIVYAAHLGDPDGPAFAGEDVSLRHEFGDEPWALPVEFSGPGVRWHIQGSLLGLERALARLSLHRMAGDELPEGPPVLDPAECRSLAVRVPLANPRDVDDASRDAVAAAIESGQRRVASLRAGGPGVDAAGRDAGLEPWRSRALEWMLEHEPAARDAFFSLGELLCLGGGPGGGRGDAWGVADDLLWGFGLRLPGPRPLDDTSGRRPEPALEESFVDLGLRVAVHLAERRLPASLGPAVVGTLMPDLLAEARPVAPDDRLGLDAWVRGLSRARLDDAVASLAGRGPLQPAERLGEAK